MRRASRVRSNGGLASQPRHNHTFLGLNLLLLLLLLWETSGDERLRVQTMGGGRFVLHGSRRASVGLRSWPSSHPSRAMRLRSIRAILSLSLPALLASTCRLSLSLDTLSVLPFRWHLFTPSNLRFRCHISTPSCDFDAISRLSLLVSNRQHAIFPIFHTVGSYLVICFLYVASLSAMCASSLPTMVLSGTPTMSTCQVSSTTVAPTLWICHLHLLRFRSVPRSISRAR